MFDIIIVCAVTGSTFASMIAGFKLVGKVYDLPPRKVIGIDASAKPKATFDQVLRITHNTAVKIGLKETDITPEDVILDERYHAGCYGIPDAATIDVIKFGAATEAFITDPVYEGKSLAGMMDMGYYVVAGYREVESLDNQSLPVGMAEWYRACAALTITGKQQHQDL